jgi:hypothetical protein
LNSVTNYALLGVLAGTTAILRFRSWRWATRNLTAQRLGDAVIEAEKLRKKDPANADRMIADAEAEFTAASERERNELRALAPQEIKAAFRLGELLQSDMKSLRLVRKGLERRVSSDPQASIGLENLKIVEQQLLQEISANDAHINRLKALR